MRTVSFLLLLMLSPAIAHAAASVAADMASSPDKQWQDLQDYEESIAFDVFGPPIKEDAKRFQEQTKLYLDMLDDYDEISDDEDDFAFVAEAYRVATSEFRPAALRPDEGSGDDIFDDDPLPSKIQSSSVYVDSIRQSVLPGPVLKPKSLDEVKLGENRAHPLFAEADKPKPKDKPKEEAKAAESKPKKEEPKKDAEDHSNAYMKAGRINAPPQSVKSAAQNAAGGARRYVSPDEETLMALRNAVKELGLEKQLNFEGGATGNQALAQPSAPDAAAADKVGGSKPGENRNAAGNGAEAKPQTAAPSQPPQKPKKKKKKKARKVQPPPEDAPPEQPAEEKKDDKEEGFSLF